MRDCTLAVVLTSSILAVAWPVWAQVSAIGDAVEQVGQGAINWTLGEVSATGIGVPPANPANPAQARAMAERAAMVVAMRNLLEIVKGVRVDSETVIENFMTKSDIIRTRVDGIVRGAMPTKKQYLSDGSVEITVSMRMRGALLDAVIPDSFGSKTVAPPPPLRPSPAASMPTDQRVTPPPAPPGGKPLPVPKALPEGRNEPSRMEPAKPPSAQTVQPEKRPEPPKLEPVPAPPPPVTSVPAADQSTVQFKGGKATGIVIDGRGLGLKPALLPKVVDSQGQELYVGQVVARTNAVEQGVAGYARDVNAAANNFRVTDNPAIMKGLRASGGARTDVVLGQSDAQKLRELSRDTNFLQYCRVIIVY